MGKRARNVGLALTGVLLGCAGGGVYYVKRGIEPMPAGKPFFVRFDSQKELVAVAAHLKEKGVVRNVTALRYYAIYRRFDRSVRAGTYQVRPGMTVDELVDALRKPIKQLVRIPETNPSYRTARLLELKEVTTATAYDEAVKSPEKFEETTGFPLPDDSLEGYLFPDTYDLPPLIGAEAVIERQLKAFEKKALPLLPDPKKRNKLLTIASMVELEAALDEERPIIAGVIKNRLDKKMRLQIDATVLYGMRDWRRLYNVDYKHVSPYNTYLIEGLPPGPICSPSVKSIQAAVNSAKHEFLYYVAKPDKHSLFAKTYEEHLRNVALARKLREQAQK